MMRFLWISVLKFIGGFPIALSDIVMLLNWFIDNFSSGSLIFPLYYFYFFFIICLLSMILIVSFLLRRTIILIILVLIWILLVLMIGWLSGMILKFIVIKIIIFIFSKLNFFWVSAIIRFFSVFFKTCLLLISSTFTISFFRGKFFFFANLLLFWRISIMFLCVYYVHYFHMPGLFTYRTSLYNLKNLFSLHYSPIIRNLIFYQYGPIYSLNYFSKIH